MLALLTEDLQAHQTSPDQTDQGTSGAAGFDVHENLEVLPNR